MNPKPLFFIFALLLSSNSFGVGNDDLYEDCEGSFKEDLITKLIIRQTKLLDAGTDKSDLKSANVNMQTIEELETVPQYGVLEFLKILGNKDTPVRERFAAIDLISLVLEMAEPDEINYALYETLDVLAGNVHSELNDLELNSFGEELQYFEDNGDTTSRKPQSIGLTDDQKLYISFAEMLLELEFHSKSSATATQDSVFHLLERYGENEYLLSLAMKNLFNLENDSSTESRIAGAFGAALINSTLGTAYLNSTYEFRAKIRSYILKVKDNVLPFSNAPDHKIMPAWIAMLGSMLKTNIEERETDWAKPFDLKTEISEAVTHLLQEIVFENELPSDETIAILKALLMTEHLLELRTEIEKNPRVTNLDLRLERYAHMQPDIVTGKKQKPVSAIEQKIIELIFESVYELKSEKDPCFTEAREFFAYLERIMQEASPYLGEETEDKNRAIIYGRHVANLLLMDEFYENNTDLATETLKRILDNNPNINSRLRAYISKTIGELHFMP